METSRRGITRSTHPHSTTFQESEVPPPEEKGGGSTKFKESPWVIGLTDNSDADFLRHQVGGEHIDLVAALRREVS
jgi:hypothetical protein